MAGFKPGKQERSRQLPVAPERKYSKKEERKHVTGTKDTSGKAHHWPESDIWRHSNSVGPQLKVKLIVAVNKQREDRHKASSEQFQINTWRCPLPRVALSPPLPWSTGWTQWSAWGRQRMDRQPLFGVALLVTETPAALTSRAKMGRDATAQRFGREGSRERPQQFPPTTRVHVSFLRQTAPTHYEPPGSSTQRPDYQGLNSWMSVPPKTTIRTPVPWKKNEIWLHQLNSLKK